VVNLRFYCPICNTDKIKIEESKLENGKTFKFSCVCGFKYEVSLPGNAYDRIDAYNKMLDEVLRKKREVKS